MTEFVLKLFKSLGRLKQKQYLEATKNSNYFNELLERFLIQVDKSDVARLVRRNGFYGLHIEYKLLILKTLLESQLDQRHLKRDTKIKRILEKPMENELNQKPLGRDLKGNWYWKLIDQSDESIVIIKELINEKEEPYFECIRNVNQLNWLVNCIKLIKFKSKCSGRGYCKIEDNGCDVVLCGTCKKTKWHERCLCDLELHYDQTEWQCPHCDQVELIANLNQIFQNN